MFVVKLLSIKCCKVNGMEFWVIKKLVGGFLKKTGFFLSIIELSSSKEPKIQAKKVNRTFSILLNGLPLTTVLCFYDFKEASD